MRQLYWIGARIIDNKGRPLGPTLGALRRNQPAPGDVVAQSFASVGVGLRGTRGTRLSIRADWGWVVNEGGVPGLDGDPGTFKAYGEGRLYASVAFIF